MLKEDKDYLSHFMGPAPLGYDIEEEEIENTRYVIYFAQENIQENYKNQDTIVGLYLGNNPQVGQIIKNPFSEEHNLKILEVIHKRLLVSYV